VARFQLAPGPVPLHHQVYEDLRAALDAGEWNAGDRLPAERDLARRYGCSLITVRRALDELRRENRVIRTQGRGTFATRPAIERDLLASGSFSDEMAARGIRPETRRVTARQEPASEKVADALGLALGAPTYFFERLRIADGEPLLLEQAHVPARRFPGLLDEDLEVNSLYDLMAGRYGAAVVRTRETIEPVLLRAREARLLAQTASRLALLLVGVAFAAGDEPVEYSETFVRGDRTKFSIDTAPVRGTPGLHQLHLTSAARGRR
jgi:GntR family transcriptional regulator